MWLPSPGALAGQVADALTNSTSSTGQQRPIAAITALTPDPAPAAALRTTSITALLSAFGLGNFLAPNFLAPNGPAAPPEAPGVWVLLGWVRRQSAYTLDNTTLSPKRAGSSPPNRAG